MISKLVGQLHKSLELSGQHLGDLSRGSTSITNNVLLMPAYVELRVELVKALAPFPDARLAVAQVLEQLENKSADQVREADKARVLAC
jgi:hypothetical protein